MDTKFNHFLILFLLAVVLAAVGCDRRHDVAAGAEEYDGMVQRADSLIDIAPDSALLLCREFFAYYPNADDSLFAKAKLVEGNAYFSVGDMEEARKSMSRAKRLASMCGDKYTLINATADLGVAMRVSQQPDSALKLYNEALALIDDDDYLDEKAHLLTSMAVLYANTGHLDEARDYADKAVKAARESNDPDLIMYANSQAGAIYNLLGNPAKALQLTHEAMADARHQNLPRYEMKALGHMIDIHLKDGNMDSVEFYLRRGESLAKQFPETSVEGLGFLEEKYVALSAMGRYRESLEIQRHLQTLRSSAPTFMPAEKLWLRMARNYRGLNLGDSAAVCYERAFEMADSLRGEDTDRQLSQFYALFQTTEKELALAGMERRKARSDMWLAIAGGILVAMIALLVSAVMYIRARKRNEKLRLLQSYLNGVEQERGRLAKDLHDGICNDLYGIEMLLQTDTDRESLLADVERIRSDVRRISHEMMPPMISEVGLAEAIDGMVRKLAHAFTKVEFTVDCTPPEGWERVPVTKAYALYRICQELLGNILKHSGPDRVDINLHRDSHSVVLTISSDGSPCDTNAEGTGIGVDSVRERLAAIGAFASGLPFSDVITITCDLE